MKKIVFIIIAVVLVVFVGYKVREKIVQSQTVAQQSPQQRGGMSFSVPAVKVVPVTPQPMKESLKLVGNIEAETEIAVQPRINGRLLSLMVEEGQPLSAGALVGVMDDETIQIQLQQSEANMATINSNIRQGEINVNKAKADKERYQELLVKRYISQREYDSYESSYMTSLAALDGLKAQLASAQKNYELLKLQLNQTKIYSPVTGVVLKKLVTPGVNLTTGTTVVTVASLNPVKLTFTLDQKDTAKITKGIAVNFSTDAFPDSVFQGRVNEVAPTYDVKTRTLQLSASLANPMRKLVPGMYGTAEIIIGNNQQALAVSQESVVTQPNGETGVFVVDSGNVAHFKPVTTGMASEGKVEITGGLQPGEMVVTIGQNRLRDGQAVQLLGGGRSGGNWQGQNGGNRQRNNQGQGQNGNWRGQNNGSGQSNGQWKGRNGNSQGVNNNWQSQGQNQNGGNQGQQFQRRKRGQSEGNGTQRQPGNMKPGTGDTQKAGVGDTKKEGVGN